MSRRPPRAGETGLLHGRFRLGERLSDEAGAALWVADKQGLAEPEQLTESGGSAGRWLVLTLPAEALVAGTEAGAALLRVLATEDELHLALARVWCPPTAGQPAALALPAPGAATVAALLGASGEPGPPALLCALLLAEALAGLAVAHARGLWHGLLTPDSLWLAGAPPARLVADCPRDPRVMVVGCGVLSLLAPAARAAAVEAAGAGPYLAPELRRGEQPGPAADLWAVGAVARRLLAGAARDWELELEPLLDALQAERATARPSADAAAIRARELALAGLASWQRTAPRPPQLAPPPPRPLLGLGTLQGLSRSRPAMAMEAPRAGVARAARWALPVPATGLAPVAWRPLSAGGLSAGLLPARMATPGLSPSPFALRTPSGPASLGLWLSLAPTAFAGVLSVLLALTLLFAVR